MIHIKERLISSVILRLDASEQVRNYQHKIAKSEVVTRTSWATLLPVEPDNKTYLIENGLHFIK